MSERNRQGAFPGATSSGGSRPSSNRIMNATQSFGRLRRGFDHRERTPRRKSAGQENVTNLLGFRLGDGRDLVLPRGPAHGIMFGITAGGEIAAQPHRDGTGGNLGKASRNDQLALGNGAGEPCRERKGQRSAIGHSNDDVPNNVPGREVLLNVASSFENRGSESQCPFHTLRHPTTTGSGCRNGRRNPPQRGIWTVRWASARA